MISESMTHYGEQIAHVNLLLTAAKTVNVALRATMYALQETKDAELAVLSALHYTTPRRIPRARARAPQAARRAQSAQAFVFVPRSLNMNNM